jgi:hypothetical protein
MPVGLALPVGADPGGGLRISRGAENDNKIVSLALGDCSNGNAFQQDIGFGPAPIFEINDPALRSTVMMRIRQVFDNFKKERRYELVEGTVKIRSAGDPGVPEGDHIMEFRYISLEVNDERFFSRSVSNPSSGFGGT